jgi:hypothetical protein
LSDDDEIRRTFAEFCQFLDDRRFEDWANLFTEDAVFNRLSGRATITCSAGAPDGCWPTDSSPSTETAC